MGMRTVADARMARVVRERTWAARQGTVDETGAKTSSHECESLRQSRRLTAWCQNAVATRRPAESTDTEKGCSNVTDVASRRKWARALDRRSPTACISDDPELSWRLWSWRAR